MKAILIAGIFLMTACKATTFQNGTYRVESAKHMNGKSVVRLEGLKKEFVFNTDTLQRGDLIYFASRPTNIVTIGQ